MFAKAVVYFLFAFSVQGKPQGLVIPPDLQDFIDAIHETCVKKIGINDDEVKSYQISNNSPQMMCYMECLMKESKWMSQNGDIQYRFIKESAHDSVKDVLLAALEKCEDIADGTQNCEKSYNFNKCLQNADPEHWFLP